MLAVPAAQERAVDDAKHEIDLLYIEQGDESHYCWIKDFSRFVRVKSDHNHGKSQYCRYCLKAFRPDDTKKTVKGYRTAQQKLDEHLKGGCRELLVGAPGAPPPLAARVGQAVVRPLLPAGLAQPETGHKRALYGQA